MPNVDLVYDADCPNASEARAQLLRAFTEAGIEARWREWRADDPDAPGHVRGFGSPTVLVEGRDVAGAAPVEGTRSCRLYEHGEEAPRGVPPVGVIAAALKAAGGASGGSTSAASRWRSSMAMVPAVGVALLPKVACPACWPAYAGFLSTVGLGFLLDASVLLPLTGTFLAIAVGALAFRARRRRGYGPFAVGLGAAAIVLLGKFSFESDAAMYAGLAVLVAASLWNSWPRRRRAAACSACVPERARASTT